MARLCDFHCRFTMLQSHLWLYKVSKMGEGDLVLMSIDAFEKREQTRQLHANVLQAEQERIDGAPTLSVSEARKQLRERMKNVAPSHKFYLLPFYCLNNMNHFL